MANYPFKINVVTKTGGQFTHYTASLVTDADVAVSASVMVDKINAMPVGGNGTYTEDEEPPSSFVAGKSFGSGGGANYLSASVTEPQSGSIVFQDVEGLSGGVDYYTFYGTKVCSVLGLPEGMPIYTENFKFSDSSTDKINYMSGQIISDNVSVKEGFKLSSQARVRSNLIWDDAFGEGYIQWVSGSITKQFMGYDPVTDVYNLGTNQITASSATLSEATIQTLTAGGLESTVNVFPINTNAASVSVQFRGPGPTIPVEVVMNNNSSLDGIRFNSANITLNGNRITLDSLGGHTYIQESSNDVLDFYVGGDNMLKIDEGNNTTTLQGNLDVGDYITALGGIHVGGTSDPGTDNLVVDGDITTAGDILPSVSATKDLGSTSKRWNNIYTTDLQLSNVDKDKGNDVDGTRGDWTLQEGDENLYVINNISGKKYKIALIPMDDKDE